MSSGAQTGVDPRCQLATARVTSIVPPKSTPNLVVSVGGHCSSTAGVTILREPFDGQFGRTFVMADPDGYRITVYERDQPLFWLPAG